MKKLKQLPFYNQYLIKNFNANAVKKIHKFAEAILTDGSHVTLEIHRIPGSYSVYLRRTTTDGLILTRSVRRKLYSDENFGEIENFWKVDPVASYHLSKIVESRIEGDKFIDLKMDDDGKVLRTFDKERLSASSMPVVNVDRGSSEAFFAKTENFLEIFKGLYSKDTLQQHNYGYRRNNITPDMVFFGSNIFSRFTDSLINSRSSFTNGATGTEHNAYVRETKDYNNAVIEKFNGESLTLGINADRSTMIFYGLTKDHGKVALSFNANGEHVPDANFSKIPVIVDILKYFDVGFELNWLNTAKEQNTVVPEITHSSEIMDLIKTLHNTEK